jgi:hypothetical protein
MATPKKEFVQLHDMSPLGQPISGAYSHSTGDYEDNDHYRREHEGYMTHQEDSSSVSPVLDQGGIDPEKVPQKVRRRKVWQETGTQQVRLTRAGKMYKKIMAVGFITRWLLFMVPIAILLAIPIIIGAFHRAEIAGVRMLWFFIWVEVVWVGLWIAKLVARLLPYVFRSVVGVVSVSTAKYATLIKALETPLSFLFWSVINVSTFLPIMTQNPDNRREPGGTKHWESIVAKILTALVLASAVFLGEQILIRLIALHFHKVQYEMRITENKWAVAMFSKLLEHSRAMFPRFAGDFDEEDAILEPGAFTGLRSMKKKGSRPGTPGGVGTPMQFVNGARRVLQVGAGVIGGVAGEVTGKGYNQAGSPYQIVVEALLSKHSCEALARRIWLSFVQEGNEALLPEDMIDVFGAGSQDEAEAAFSFFDTDLNGDVSLDEMLIKIHEVARERKAISSSLKDTDSAIGKLDNVFCLIAFVISVFILVALLDTSFKTILTTSATGLLSLSFIFGATCQEIVASLIFVFVKHPFDVADRCIINGQTYIVQEMSLMFTILKRGDGTQVQAPNSLLNTLFIDNIRRSAAMLEVVKIDVDFGTTFEQIEQLRLEMLEFVKRESRDFFNAFDISIDSFAGLSKMTISMAIKHKSNWQNDALRCQRRNKWMCALALAIKKLEIVASGPGAGDPKNPFVVRKLKEEALSEGKAFQDRPQEITEYSKIAFDPTFGTRTRPTDAFDVNLRSGGAAEQVNVTLPNTLSEDRDLLFEEELKDATPPLPTTQVSTGPARQNSALTTRSNGSLQGRRLSQRRTQDDLELGNAGPYKR